MRTISLALAALVATPVVAQAGAVPAARSGSPVADAENIHGGWFLPALAVIAILLGTLAITSGGDDDLPTSP